MLRIAINILNFQNKLGENPQKVNAAYSTLGSCLDKISEGSNTADVIATQKLMANYKPNATLPD